MTLAALALPPDDAGAILSRLRAVLGLKGELKGSRIDLAERAFLIELLFGRTDARAVIATVSIAQLRARHLDTFPEDIAIYARLLEAAIAPWIAASGGCIAIEIDDGRYDPRLNGLLRADVQKSLGQWGSARLADSKRSAGVQLADVLANSAYQIGIASARRDRIGALLAPFIDNGAIRLIDIGDDVGIAPAI